MASAPSPASISAWTNGASIWRSPARRRASCCPPASPSSPSRPKALAAAAEAKSFRCYFDFADMTRTNKDGYFPYTPATTLLRGLRASLDLLLSEGLEQVFQRHHRLAEGVRRAVAAWGLKLCASHPRWHSDTVSAIVLPEGFDSNDVVRHAYERYNLSLGVGLAKVAGKVFRIGHLGSLNEIMLLGALAGAEMALRRSRHSHRARQRRRRGAGALRRAEAGDPCLPAPRRRRLTARAGAAMDIHEYQAKELLAGFGVPVAARRPRLQPGAGGLSGPRDRRRALGGEGADPCRRPRQGRRRQALPRRARGRGGGRGAARQAPGHRTRPGRAASWSTASMSRPPAEVGERALSRLRPRPEERAGHGRGLGGRRHGDRGDRATTGPRP